MRDHYEYFETITAYGYIVAAYQIKHNTISPGVEWEKGGMSIGIRAAAIEQSKEVEGDIVINCDPMTNPPSDLIVETTDIICEIARTSQAIKAGDLRLVGQHGVYKYEVHP